VSLGATKIRQVLDNIQISSGYSTQINSSSLLLSLIDNGNGVLDAKDVTFTSSSPSYSSVPFSAANLSDKYVTTTTNDSRYRDMADRPIQSNNESNENSSYKYSFKNAKIRNLKIYGSYEVIVQSSAGSRIFVPEFPSFSDYVAISLSDGFDATIKLSDSKPSYAEFEVIGDNNEGAAKVNSTFQRLRIYGDDAMESSGKDRGLSSAYIKSNEIHFHEIRSDLAGNGYTSLLMKSPQFQIKKEVSGMGGSMQRDNVRNIPQEDVNTILTFKRDSPETEPIEITNEAGSEENVVFRIDYVDSYNEPFREGIKNHYLTYIEKDIEITLNDIDKHHIENDQSFAYQYSTKMSGIRLPGDISEHAKAQGVGVQWQRAITSYSGLLLAILIIITSIIATKIAIKVNSWPKPKSS
jgi:hypothetical protein